jgi:hypothetical protein
MYYIPTLEEASVRLFNVVDFPLDGCAPHMVSGVLGEKMGGTDLAHKANEGIAGHDGLSQALGGARRIEMPRVVSREIAKS